MSDHCYTDVVSFWKFLQDQGADQYHGADSLILSILESSSRAVDAFCNRTGDHTVSGFGPRIGTNYYDIDDRNILYLDDDLLTATTTTVKSSTGDTGTAWTLNTHFYLRPYDRNPKRILAVVDTGGVTLSIGRKLVSIAGTWGYQNVTRPLVAVVGAGDWTIGGTSLLVSDATDVSPGMTIWCGTEMLYISDINATTIAVTRGANGSTAATHTAAAALTAVVYPPGVADATVRLAARRWKSRDAGLTGDFGGGGGLPAIGERAGELAILGATVGQFRIPNV